MFSAVKQCKISKKMLMLLHVAIHAVQEPMLVNDSLMGTSKWVQKGFDRLFTLLGIFR